MSVIGLGKAYRDQTRAAEATRSRSDRGGRFEASDALPAVVGRASCASCGVELDRAQLVFAEEGTVCLGCEADAALDGVSGPGVMQWLAEAAVPVPAVLCALLTTVPWLEGVQPGGKGGAFWAITSAVGLIFAGVGGLVAARTVASANMPAVDPAFEVDRADRRLLLALGGWGVGGNLAAALWMLALWVLIFS